MQDYFQVGIIFLPEGLGTCDSLLFMSHTQQSALETGQEAGIVQFDFNAAFDMTTHQ